MRNAERVSHFKGKLAGQAAQVFFRKGVGRIGRHRKPRIEGMIAAALPANEFASAVDLNRVAERIGAQHHGAKFAFCCGCHSLG